MSRSRSFTFALRELGFGLLELAQALLPFTLEAARNETVLGIDSAIAAFGTMPRTGLRSAARRYWASASSRSGFDPFGGGERGFETPGASAVRTARATRVVDLHCADAQLLRSSLH